VSSGTPLRFEDSEFDLVICKSVLHWVRREEILQTIGELFRVSRQYVLIMDFCPSRPYKTPYSHKPGLWTFKTDYSKLIEGANIASKVYEYNFCDLGATDADVRGRELTQDEIHQGSYDWLSRRLTIWEKTDLFPVREKEEFNFT
jgi:SAM-dependent methyltransferase